MYKHSVFTLLNCELIIFHVDQPGIPLQKIGMFKCLPKLYYAEIFKQINDGISKIQALKCLYIILIHPVYVYLLLLLSAAPVRGRHSGSSVMIRILIWHRFYAGCPS